MTWDLLTTRVLDFMQARTFYVQNSRVFQGGCETTCFYWDAAFQLWQAAFFREMIGSP